MLNSEAATKTGKMYLESKYYIGILYIESDDSSNIVHSGCNLYKGKEY